MYSGCNGTEYPLIVKADTIEELAQLTEMDVDVLKATIERYNASCNAGVCALPQIIGSRYFGCGSLIMICGGFGRTAGPQAAPYVK